MISGAGHQRLEESDIRRSARETPLAVRAELRAYVESIAILEPVQAYLALPGPRVQLLLRRREGAAHLDAYMVGARTLTKHKLGGDRPTLAGRFFPGAARVFLRCPVSDLTNAVLHLEEGLGSDGARFAGALASVTDLRSAAASVQALLLARLKTAVQSEGLRVVRHATALLEARRVTVADLAHKVGLSERHLRRVFVDACGLSPKTYARTLRFQRVLALRRSAPTRSWASVALAAGYFDQAHMIDDFHNLAGVTPGALLGNSPNRADSSHRHPTPAQRRESAAQ